MLITGGHKPHLLCGGSTSRPASAPASRGEGRRSLSQLQKPRKARIESPNGRRSRQRSKNKNKSVEDRKLKKMFVRVTELEERQHSPSSKGSHGGGQQQHELPRRSSAKSQNCGTYYLLVTKDVEKALEGKMIAILEPKPSSRASSKSKSRSGIGKEPATVNARKMEAHRLSRP